VMCVSRFRSAAVLDFEFHFTGLRVNFGSVHVEAASAGCGLVEGDTVFVREVAVLDAKRGLIVGLGGSVAL